MKTLEQQLDAAGLRVFGCCEKISAYGPDLLQHAPLLQDFSPAEADVLGASLRLVRAEPGQVMMREGEAGEWMMLVLKGTVDVTKRVWREGESPAPATPVDPATAADLDAAEPVALSAAVTRVGVVRRGTALGEMSLLDGEPRSTQCTAISPVQCAGLSREGLDQLIVQQPLVAARLLAEVASIIANRLRALSDQLRLYGELTASMQREIDRLKARG